METVALVLDQSDGMDLLLKVICSRSRQICVTRLGDPLGLWFRLTKAVVAAVPLLEKA